jgi:acyl phosphate:glycerol-3-phosphate acyltransferase
MTWQMVLVVAAVGYLLGSLSFARLIARLAKPDMDLSRIEVTLPNGEVFVSDSVSATALRMKIGTRFGLLTVLLDGAKVAIPMLIVRAAFPDQPYLLVAAAAGLIGHVWPLYHRFKGGRGESVIYGAFLVIDPLAVVGTTLLGTAAGFVAGNILVLRWAGMVLMVPWLWIAAGDPRYALFALFADAVFLWAMRPELRQYGAWKTKGIDPSNEEIAAEYGMGGGLGRALDRYGMIPALVRRFLGQERSAP